MKIHSIKFNFIMNIIMTVSSVVYPLITFPYISRVLLVEGSGKVAWAYSVVSYFTMFATLGLPTYGIRACARVRDDKEELSRTVQELLIISAVTTALTYLAFFVLLFFVPKFAAQKELLMIMAVSIGLTTFGVQWLYNALEQYSYITACALIFKLIGMALMFLFVKEPADYLVYGVIYVIANFGSYVLNFIRLWQFISFRKTGTYNIRRHLKSTVVFFLLSAASSVYLNLDVVMLGFMRGDTEVGYYNASVKVKTVLVACVTSLGAVLLPRLSYYIQNGRQEEFKNMVVKAFNFVFVAAASVSIYFAIYSRESILFLAGEAFLPAVLPMIILLPTTLMIGLSNVTGIQILTPLGEEKKVVYSVAAGALLDFVLNLVLIPKYGATGAAISTLLAEILVVIVQGYYLWDNLAGMFREIQFWKIGAALGAASAVGALIKYATDFGVFLTLCMSAVLFFGVYGAVLLLLKEPFAWEIVDTLWGFVRKKK